MLLATVSLLAGLAMALLTLAAQPVRTTSDDLVRDLLSGEAAEVQSSSDRDGATLVAWRRGGVAHLTSVPALQGDPADVAAALERQASAAGRPIVVEVVAAPSTVVFDARNALLKTLLLSGFFAAVLTLLIMLSAPSHSLTSRWGWLWIFSTPLGPPLYWLLEPRPLWWTRDTATVTRPYRELGGGIAYLVSIGLEVLFVGIVGVLVLWGLHRAT